ncbi:MAG: heavy metal translocating P-type ATPase [Candidatus Spechtbacterales bacterium]
MSDCCDDKRNKENIGSVETFKEGSVFYTCPMHPEVAQKIQGMCGECGMSLVPKKENKHKKNKEHIADKHEGHSTKAFKNKAWASLVLSVPIVLYSDIMDVLFGYQAPVFRGSEFLPFVLGTFIFFYGGWIFIASSYRELRAKLPGMMTLIALAISVAYFYSTYTVFFDAGPDLFWELSTLITIMLFGHWFEMRAVSGAQGALKELSKLLPDKAEVLREGKTITVSVSEIKENDIIIVKPGGKIPTDGIVLEGSSEVNESIVTGESKPVFKNKDDEVIAGTINGDGSLTIHTTNAGEETFLAGIMRLVAEAQASKSRLQMLSDRAAYYLTIIAVTVGGLTFGVWLSISSPDVAVTRMVAVLVIACPHALGLAIPLVASISITKAAGAGFIVKQRIALESARNIDMVLFDKTGTLTKGEFGVDAVMPVGGNISKEEVLKLAASVNKFSEHPIAYAIAGEAEKKGIVLEKVKDFERIPGKGAKARIGESKVVVGSATIVEDLSLKQDKDFNRQTNEFSHQGKTVVYVIKDEKLIGAIALLDIIREQSREAINALHGMGIKTAMVTGDSEDVAKWVAEELGMDEYFAKVLPEQKSNRVKELQKRGFKVAMVGDGVNDAPALTQADLGIAIGAGTNVAIESAGIILVRNNPQDIVGIIRLSRMSYRKMIQNLFWATGYNVLAIPLAAGVLASKGILLQPAVAAIFMSASTVIVATNAMLLKKSKI